MTPSSSTFVLKNIRPAWLRAALVAAGLDLTADGLNLEM
jgi:hypothetical protein